jgi:hypothetical protein
MQRKALFLAIIATLLTACGPKPATDTPPPAAAETAVKADAPAGSAQAETAASQLFSVSPDKMSDCQTVVAKVRWDVRTQHPDVAAVEIFVGPDTAPTIFAAAGTNGELDTGPWTGAGAIFRLRDKATGAELARVNVTGPDCSKP